MSDEPLTNAAVEFARRSVDRINALDGPPAAFGRISLTQDFTFEDRRTGGMNFGTIEGVEAYATFVETYWGVGSGRPQSSLLEVVALRGERCAASVQERHYGHGYSVDFIDCVRLSPNLRQLQRRVHFDPDSRDDAIALLDEWHAEIGD
jgi:hypothetical protein